jgi:hypothetical protein
VLEVADIEERQLLECAELAFEAGRCRVLRELVCEMLGGFMGSGCSSKCLFALDAETRSWRGIQLVHLTWLHIWPVLGG